LSGHSPSRREIAHAGRAERLVAELKRQWLLVLDGLDRVFVNYHRYNGQCPTVFYAHCLPATRTLQ
jgi:hypothetical protein